MTSPSRSKAFVILWWMDHKPMACAFDNELSAEAAANVRNATMLTLSGIDIKIEKAVDYWRRDEQGAPMPFEWRDIGNPLPLWQRRTLQLPNAI